MPQMINSNSQFIDNQQMFSENFARHTEVVNLGYIMAWPINVVDTECRFKSARIPFQHSDRRCLLNHSGSIEISVNEFQQIAISVTSYLWLWLLDNQWMRNIWIITNLQGIAKIPAYTPPAEHNGTVCRNNKTPTDVQSCALVYLNGYNH